MGAPKPGCPRVRPGNPAVGSVEHMQTCFEHAQPPLTSSTTRPRSSPTQCTASLINCVRNVGSLPHRLVTHGCTTTSTTSHARMRLLVPTAREGHGHAGNEEGRGGGESNFHAQSTTAGRAAGDSGGCHRTFHTYIPWLANRERNLQVWGSGRGTGTGARGPTSTHSSHTQPQPRPSGNMNMIPPPHPTHTHKHTLLTPLVP